MCVYVCVSVLPIDYTTFSPMNWCVWASGIRSVLVGKSLSLSPTCSPTPTPSHPRPHATSEHARPDIWVARRNVSNNGWVSCSDASYVVGRLSGLDPWDCRAGPPRSSERMTTEQGGLHWEPKAKLSEPTQAAQAALLVAQWSD